ncbi:tail assembly protein [Pseudomonas phage vB_PaeS_PAO1_Ab19]|uniref:tail assembly protein n=1 Tax=Pseudomonas phage vB_PaeS_PAO1_Ab19 TaxID=1548912 RepID=UPI0018AF7FD6|nr:tail assembly protein [Pseudomonas phage vB_PaeS_PAO1_Ab19]
MSYATYENSLERGTPVELYEFIQGTKRWSYASCAEDVQTLGQVFTAAPIKRGRVQTTTDIFKDGVTLTFPRDNPFASQFLGFAPEEVTTLTIRRGHYGDPDEEFIVYWKGRVAGAKAANNEITIECESVFTSIKRPGLRARFEYGCRHALYSAACGANREPLKHTGTVQSIAGGVHVSVSGAASQPNGFYTGGMLVTPDGAARFITNHVGNVLTISRPLQSLAGAMTVAVYPGCDHLRDTCKNKFNNLDNFGGFPFIPSKNPFGGSSIV